MKLAKIAHKIGITHPHPDIPDNLPSRRWLYDWLLNPKIENNHQKAVDNFISTLIIANLFAFLLEGIPPLFEAYKNAFEIFDNFSIAIFTAEYFIRLALSVEDEEFKNRKSPYLRYAASPLAMIDFLSIVPFFLQSFISIDLRLLRFFRLLRILKLFRVIIAARKEFIALNQGRSFRQKIHALLFPNQFSSSLQKVFDVFIIICIIISVASIILESVESVEHILFAQFAVIDRISVVIFTVEYVMRIYACVEEPEFEHHPIAGRFKYAKKFSSVIDLLAILPFFLEIFLAHLFDLRFLRVFRLLRLLKLTRYTGATSTLTKVISREWSVLVTAAFIMFLLVILTASLGYLFEHDAQPEKFENIPQAIYWAVITLASVGYGDISPVTPMGRMMTIILALLGIGIFAIPAALLSSSFTDQLRIERETLKNELYEMLADGIISPEEEDIINREAKRLHLNQEEVTRLIEKARWEREVKDDLSQMPLHKIAQTPQHALEYYKTLLSQIKQLSLMTDNEAFESIASQKTRLTPNELALWRKIREL